MISSRDDKRDVTLTTLIDLLVQVVFVFTLILVASGAVQGSAEERGYLAPEVWKTLISIFDVDPKKTSPEEQIAEIESKYKTAQRERDDLRRERDDLRKKLDELDAQIAVLEKKAGAPGYPPCRAKDGKEEYVLEARIDAAGKIVASLSAGAKALQSGIQAPEVNHRALSRSEFQQEFSRWRQHGLARDPQCKYVAIVGYDPKAVAGDYQPAISEISSIFRIGRIAKQGEK